MLQRRGGKGFLRWTKSKCFSLLVNLRSTPRIFIERACITEIRLVKRWYLGYPFYVARNFNRGFGLRKSVLFFLHVHVFCLLRTSGAATSSKTSVHSWLNEIDTKATPKTKKGSGDEKESSKHPWLDSLLSSPDVVSISSKGVLNLGKIVTHLVSHCWFARYILNMKWLHTWKQSLPYIFRSLSFRTLTSSTQLFSSILCI